LKNSNRQSKENKISMNIFVIELIMKLIFEVHTLGPRYI
jgi:hypothetical protein